MCGAMHFIYQVNRLRNHESIFNLFGLISQQCTMYMSCGRAQTHDHQIGSQRLTLLRPTGRISCVYCAGYADSHGAIVITV